MHLYENLLGKLARVLDSADIRYMVIGGQAVLLHGEPRLTRDIDVTIGSDASILDRLLEITSGADMVPSIEDPHEFVRKTNVLPLTDRSSSIRVDLIFSFTPYEAEAIQRSIPVALGGTRVKFAAVEDLIIHKLVAGRPRDIDDVRGVLAATPEMDEAYLTKWLASFRGVVHRDLVSEFNEIKKTAAR